MKSAEVRLRLEGERRQVTALFYDIVGSTEILMRSDPEQYLRSVTALNAAAETIVTNFGGFLYQKLGDGGCCFFGYPKQSEDAAENAIDAALELLRKVSRRTRKAADNFDLRIGIATGVVVFSSNSDEIVGTAPVLAARLQAEAEANSVLVAETTFELTRSKFVYNRIGEVKLKGFATPNILWQPEAKRQGPSQQAGNINRAMVGRAQELATLHSAWKAARAGNGQAFAIIGEAGIGKSRLVSELLGSVEGKGVVLQCNKRFEGQPLYPLVTFLDNLIDFSALKAAGSDALGDAFRAAGIDIDLAAVETMRGFAVARSGASARNIRVTDMTGSVFRNSVIDAAIQVLCPCMSAGPILIVMEDVNWADEMTLELLDRLNAMAATLPILVVATSRHARADDTATGLSLGGLPPTEMRDLIAAVWESKPPAGLSDFVLKQCDGMPLYAEQLTDFLRAKYNADQHVTAWKDLLAEGGVSSLNDLLSSRLASAGEARRVAQFASVIGRNFTSDLLAKLLPQPDRDGLASHMQVLSALGIIEHSPNQAEGYQFRQALLQEAAYNSLLKSDRRKIHERIANLLVDKTVPPLPAAIAAWQCAEAGRHADAVQFALKAAEACVLQSAMKEASLSLDLCGREITRMSRRHPERHEFFLTMLELQAVVATALEGEGSDKARRIYSRTMQLARLRPPSTRQGHFPAYWGWWFTAPNVRTQQQRARILVDDMRMVNDGEVRMQSFHCAWATSFHAGDHAFCLDCVEQGLELYDPDLAVRNRAFFGGHDAKICGLGERALSQLLTDRVEASEDAISQSLDYAASIDHVGSLVHAIYYALVHRHCQGRYEEVHVLGEQMLMLAEKHGLAASKARAEMYCGWAELIGAKDKRGAIRFREALLLHQRTATDDNLSIHSDMHSQVLEMTGHPSEALSVIEAAINLGRKSGQTFWLAELYRRKAQLRQSLGDRPTSLRRDLAHAVKIANSQGAAWLLKRAEADLGRIG
ncbi:ATP-binding protein [Paracoccus aestuariivivens]|uniref:AAA family ATPase n=1 Tax=Paracoccus aestuariivivens TaxID=1820333 RepID=A0A6L6JDW7_9RHOB|nr:AAA family ATPase [Paracoccus aestuariivivens]MTH78101.1 AAA family ATPase [Paracoccus aestuariivivens]